MNNLLTAIVDDDRKAVETLLRADGGLAARLIRQPKFYDSKIFHWIYVGDTALHLAAAGYRVEIVRLLLTAGANPNAATNHRRSSPLHYAADGFISSPAWDAQRQVETICCLLDKGAHIHSQDKNGATPLHRAVRTRCAAAVRCLLRAGRDPTLKNKPGSTPFHLAVQNTGQGWNGCGSGRQRAARDHQRVPFLWREPRTQERQRKEREGLFPERLDSRSAAVIAADQVAWCVPELPPKGAQRKRPQPSIAKLSEAITMCPMMHRFPASNGIPGTGASLSDCMIDLPNQPPARARCVFARPIIHNPKPLHTS